jgi:glutaminase
MDRHELCDVIEELHRKYLPLTDGDVATYIPELANSPPDDFGIALASAGGQVFEAGDARRPFTIQSISKPLTFGMAVEEFGEAKVARHVGVEPSGEAFNSIKLQDGENRPHNPMVNAGAISVAALLYDRYGDKAIDRVLDRLSAAVGRRLSIDQDVFESEQRTGHRNRAIAHLLLNFGIVQAEAERALDVYFKQCSILVTCRDLAAIGATLSNMGRHPITGEQVFDLAAVKSMLSIMFTCGMYDYSGEWAYRVGVPAKSGVSGGLMAVVNRQLGVATYSPRLDRRGNSCRGIAVCIEMAARFGLHAFDCLNVGSSFLEVVLQR